MSKQEAENTRPWNQRVYRVISAPGLSLLIFPAADLRSLDNSLLAPTQSEFTLHSKVEFGRAHANHDGKVSVSGLGPGGGHDSPDHNGHELVPLLHGTRQHYPARVRHFCCA